MSIQVKTGNMLDVIVEGKSIGLKQRDSDHRKYEVIWLPEPEGLRDVLTAEINRLNPCSPTGKVSEPVSASVAPTVDANEAANKIADYFNAPPSVIPAVEQIIQRCLPAAASLAAKPIGYEHAVTTGWDKHNARRHALIEAKRSRALSDNEAAELSELQWLAGIKRALQTGPTPVLTEEAETKNSV